MNFQRILTSWSIRKKRFFLALVIFLPALTIIVCSSLNQRREAIQKAERHASLVAESLASQQAHISRSTKTVLTILS